MSESIYPNQSGLKQDDSCIDQFLSINHHIYHSLDEGFEVCVALRHFKGLGSLLFLIYDFLLINDLSHTLRCNLKLVANDISLFSIVRNIKEATKDLTNDFIKITQWDFQ